MQYSANKAHGTLHCVNSNLIAIFLETFRGAETLWQRRQTKSENLVLHKVPAACGLTDLCFHIILHGSLLPEIQDVCN